MMEIDLVSGIDSIKSGPGSIDGNESKQRIQIWIDPAAPIAVIKLRDQFITVLSEVYQVTTAEKLLQLNLIDPILYFGAELIPKLVGNAVIVQTASLEFIFSANGFNYLKQLRQYPVWEASQTRAAILNQHEIVTQFYCLNYPTLAPSPIDEEYDILFWGQPNSRQQYFLNQLMGAGVYVAIDPTMDPHNLTQGLILLQLNESDSGSFDPNLMNLLIRSGRCIVSEAAEMTRLSSGFQSDKPIRSVTQAGEYGKGIYWTPVNQPNAMAQTLKWLLLHPVELTHSVGLNQLTQNKLSLQLPGFPSSARLSPIWSEHFHIVIPTETTRSELGLSAFEVNCFRLAGIKHFRELKSNTISFGSDPVSYARNYILTQSAQVQANDYSSSYPIIWIQVETVLKHWFNYELSRLFMCTEIDLGIILLSNTLNQAQADLLNQLEKCQSRPRIELIIDPNAIIFPPKLIILLEFKPLVAAWASRLGVSVILLTPLPSLYQEQFKEFIVITSNKLVDQVDHCLGQYQPELVRAKLLKVKGFN